MSNDLDSMLAAYAKHPLPEFKGPSRSEIWGAIEQRRKQSSWTRIFSTLDLRDLFSEPRMAVAALAFAALVGVVPAAVLGRTQNERRLARQSIHFEVFAVSQNPLGFVFIQPGLSTSESHR
jgi:hypothetical protein